jgi:hypothetical protein
MSADNRGGEDDELSLHTCCFSQSGNRMIPIPILAEFIDGNGTPDGYVSLHATDVSRRKSSRLV